LYVHLKGDWYCSASFEAIEKTKLKQGGQLVHIHSFVFYLIRNKSMESIFVSKGEKNFPWAVGGPLPPPDAYVNVCSKGSSQIAVEDVFMGQINKSLETTK
jgi:hypothetical protein